MNLNKNGLKTFIPIFQKGPKNASFTTLKILKNKILRKKLKLKLSENCSLSSNFHIKNIFHLFCVEVNIN
jgi:hypothetical protein